MPAIAKLIGFFAQASAEPWIWPLPQNLVATGNHISLSKNFEFSVGADSGVLARAANRYEAYMKMNATAVADSLQACSVTVSDTTEQLTMNTSHRYSIRVSNAACHIDADTVFGAMYGMESLYQMSANGTLPNSDITVQDFPDYVHRGIMIDTGRRFWPVPLVRSVIDVMSFNKMNVLHLHASDMCRFGVESKLFPELTGTLSGIKEGHYTQQEVKELIAYALDRGVQILPEFDMPGHAACFIPMEHRGVKWCNKPNESPIPNWCTLQAGNGTAAWDLMPQLALEMANLFGSNVYHIGGDETRCGGSGEFESHLLEILAENGYRGMGWSETQGVRRSDTIVHAWKGNASFLASQGIPTVDSRPNHFYRGVGRTTPVVTGTWTDLDKKSVPAENRSFLLGGEFVFWTDAYCYINGCTRPGSGQGGGAALFGPNRNDEFTRSAAGMLWPFGSLAAGSFWHYDEHMETDEVKSRALYTQNTLASWRGGMVCPTGCDCTMTSICGEPLIPSPAPTPPAPASKACKWHSDTGIEGTDFKKVDVQSKEECCAACVNTEGCLAAEFSFLTEVCQLMRNFSGVWRNDGSLACVPTEQIV